MAEAKSGTLVNSPAAAPVRPRSGLVGSSPFKYYIHDSVKACRLELLGSLHEEHLEEMNGCWQTAKTTLGDRQLILDLRRLGSADSASDRWLADMADQGAAYLPASYRNAQMSPNGQSADPRQFAKGKLFARLFVLLRRGCAAAD